MRLLVCLVLTISLVAIGGCSWPTSPVVSGLILEQKGPVAAFSPDVKSTRVGRAKAEGILLFGFGDASITAAQAAGGITRIHHVDSQVANYLGIYAKYETVVYGE